MTRRTGACRAAVVLALATAAAGGCTSSPAAAPARSPSPTAARTSPGLPTGPPSAPTATAGGPPTALAAGMYAWVTTAAGPHLALLTPGTTTWRYGAEVPVPATDHILDNVVSRSFDLRRFLEVRTPSGSLWDVAVDGSDRHLIVTPPKGLKVCSAGYDAAGDRIYYGLATGTNRRFALYTVRPDGTDRHAVPGVTDAMLCSVAWSADGSTMAFTNEVVADPSVRAYHTVLVSDGKSMREVVVRLPDTTRLYGVPGMSADGRYAAVLGIPTSVASSGDATPDQVYVVDLRTGTASRIQVPPDWTVDTTAVLFDPSGPVFAAMATSAKDGTTDESVGVFDRHGMFVRQLPNPSTNRADVISLWGIVP